jgi:hypothetical protein
VSDASKPPAAEGARWRPGSRVGRIRRSHSYGVVLLLIVASFLFAAIAPDSSWSGSVLVLLEGLTLIGALWTSGLARADSPASYLVVAIVVAAAVVNIVAGGDPSTAAVAILSALLTVAIVAVIALGVVDQGVVNRQSVTGAICIYILLGMMFVFAYGTIATLDSGPFFAQGTDGTRSLRLYFSYVTLATLGYGDYTADSSLGHTLSIVEALLGQLYLVTVVAVLVSRMGGGRHAGGDGGKAPSLIPPG